MWPIELTDPIVRGSSTVPPEGWAGDLLTIETARQIAAHNMTVLKCDD